MGGDMAFKEEKHHRRSIRLPGYDYSGEGWYFVTICVQNRECLFGQIENNEMMLNELGKIVRDEWLKTPVIRPNVLLDEFAIMPNHVHGIVVIAEKCRGVLQYAPTKSVVFRSPSQTIGAIIRGFKSVTTNRINMGRQTPAQPVWQRNYYEHIIRNEKSYWAIKEYIQNNPLNWASDEENPLRIKK